MGGILIWFFLAGTFIMVHPSSTLNKSFRQMISGIQHFAVMGKQTGSKLYNWIYRIPSMEQFSFTGGILTATFTKALYFFLILNLTSSKYQNLSLLLTENTYSSRLSNSGLLHLAITLSMNGLLLALSYKIYSFKPMATSSSQIEPGNRTFFPKATLVLLISTKYLVSSNTSFQFQIDLKFSSSWSAFSS